MRDIKTLAQGLEASAQPRNVTQFIEETGNIYKSLVIIAKRSKQISRQLKEELHSKLEEFASSSESLEEVHENKEQIEISKFYERLPNPVIIATNEFLNGNIYYREKTEEDMRKEQESRYFFNRRY